MRETDTSMPACAAMSRGSMWQTPGPATELVSRGRSQPPPPPSRVHVQRHKAEGECDDALSFQRAADPCPHRRHGGRGDDRPLAVRSRGPRPWHRALAHAPKRARARATLPAWGSATLAAHFARDRAFPQASSPFRGQAVWPSLRLPAARILPAYTSAITVRVGACPTKPSTARAAGPRRRRH